MTLFFVGVGVGIAIGLVFSFALVLWLLRGGPEDVEGSLDD